MGSEAYARSSDPQTSHDAADAVRITATEQEVYDAVCIAGSIGMNKQECARYLNKQYDCVSPRFKPLERKGLIVRCGTREASSGHQQEVWRKAPPGHVYKEEKKFKWTDAKVIEFYNYAADQSELGYYFTPQTILEKFKLGE